MIERTAIKDAMLLAAHVAIEDEFKICRAETPLHHLACRFLLSQAVMVFTEEELEEAHLLVKQMRDSKLSVSEEGLNKSIAYAKELMNIGQPEHLEVLHAGKL